MGGGNHRGDTDLDVTILKIDYNVPVGVNCLSFAFRFFSQEYPTYTGQAFNDAFIAEWDSSTWTTSGSTISAPNNFASPSGGGVISVNASLNFTQSKANGTGYINGTEGGGSDLLRASTTVTSGSHSLYLSIFDQGDSRLDSGVYIDDLRFFSAASCGSAGVGSSLSISPGGALPTGYTGTGYSQTLTASGGTAPYNFTLSGGTIPPGLTLSSGGVLSGVPTASGSYTLTVQVTDSNGNFGFKDYPIQIIQPTPSNITVSGGGGQTTPVTNNFTNPLRVRVTDSMGRPVPYATVTYTVPGIGASATLSSYSIATDIGGYAEVTATANTKAGSYNVTAAVSGVATPATFSLTNTPGTAAAISINNGDNQSASVNTAFANPLKVLVQDAYNNPVQGSTITYTANPSGGGASATLSNGSATTNASGLAQVTATANGTLGTYTVTATLAGVGSVTFNLTNIVGNPNSIIKVTGDNQSATVGTGFTTAIKVQVVDSGGNPLPNKTVTFSTPSSGASATLSSTSATTDGSGYATITATANTVTGSYPVTVSVAGVSSVTFALTNTPAAASKFVLVSGDPQSTGITNPFAQPLKVRVTDANDNPISGTAVSFAATTSAGGATATLNSASVNTDANGYAQVTATANNKLGAYTVTATTGLGSLTFNLNNLAGNPASITITGGNNQTTTVTQAFGQPLVVQVLDSQGNPVNGVSVVFSSIGSGAGATFVTSPATTNASGYAQVVATANNSAGSFTVNATINGLTATFNLTNTPLAASQIIVNSGNNQSKQINTLFSLPLKAKVTDQYGNPIAGVSVTFTVNPVGGAGGTLDFATVTTDGSGIATVNLTANGTTGSYNITATGTGLGTATFVATNTAGAPGSINLVGGNNQSTVINTAFAQPLQVEVRDGNNNLVPNATVNFTVNPVNGAGASVSTTATTNGSGVASVTATANLTVGSYTITATVTGVGTPLTFNLTNTPGAAKNITTYAGSGTQSTVISNNFTSDLQVQVTDAGNNPVPGVTVTFVTPGSPATATLSSTTATTDSNGVAKVTATANTKAGSYIVTASATGTGNASFNLTNLAGSPTSVTVAGGNNQTTAISTAFAQPLKVLVVDGSNNPVPNITVNYTLNPAGNGAGATFSGTATTDANGNAQVIATANNKTGNYSVSAAVVNAGSATFNLTNAQGTAGSIITNTGNPQSTQINTVFALPLEVLVRDAGNNPVSNATVTFTVNPVSGAGAGLNVTTVNTDVNGLAQVTATANATAGSFTVTATVSGAATPATFNLTNLAGAPGNLSIRNGGTQSTVILTQFGQSLQVKVVDAGNNPVQNATVSYSVTPVNGAGATLSNATASTDVNGLAQINATANPTVGSYTVTASVNGVATPVTFNLTNTVGTPNNLTLDSGNNQSTVINTTFGSPLRVRVRDAGNNPVPNVTVTFTVTPSNNAGANLNSGTATTDGNGYAQVIATANMTVGSYPVNATVNGIATPVTFTLTNLVGAPNSLILDSGNNQTTNINTVFGLPLKVRVRDAGNNPVPNVTVSYAVPGNGATANLSSTTAKTDASGYAQVTATANGTAGSYTVIAFVSGVNGLATFNLTNVVPSTPNVLALDSGNNQSTPVTTAYAAPLKVRVTNNGTGQAGLIVNFTVNTVNGAGAILNSPTAITDANGYAQVNATANSNVGTFTVTATVVGISTPVTFNLTNTVGSGSTGGIKLTLDSGNNQTTYLNTAYGLPLRVKVSDNANNPVQGAVITYTINPVNGAAGTLNSVTATSDAVGFAQVTIFANNTPGSFTVTATINGVPTVITFNLTNVTNAGTTKGTVRLLPTPVRVAAGYGDNGTPVLVGNGGNPELPPSKSSVSLQIAGSTTGIPVGARGFIGMVTNVRCSAGGNFRFWTGATVPSGNHHNIPTALPAANLTGGFITNLDTDGKVNLGWASEDGATCGYAVDVVGYVVDPSPTYDAVAFLPTPLRVSSSLGTNASPKLVSVGPTPQLNTSSTITIQMTGAATGIPVGTKGIIGMVTNVGCSAGGNFRFWTGNTAPDINNLNIPTAMPNLNLTTEFFTIIDSDGKVNFGYASQNGADCGFAVDILGYVIAPNTYTSNVTMLAAINRSAIAVDDSRLVAMGGVPIANTTASVSIQVSGDNAVAPAGVKGVFGIVTNIKATAGGNLRFWSGAGVPDVNSLNIPSPMPNLNLNSGFAIPLDANGRVNLGYGSGTGDSSGYAVDIVAYYN